MGQTLSEPIVEKHSQKGGDDTLLFGLSDMQGWRISMEDSHAAVLQLNGSSGKDKVSFFGVYDGHGGDAVAQYSGEHVHRIISQDTSFIAGDYEKALKNGFLNTDKAIREEPRFKEDPSGCTASVVLITGDGRIFCANAGDSRSVLCVRGEAKPLSFDHKPQNELEKARICAAGGFVDFGRVNGNLALSRAIGDFEFKKNADLPPEQQIVTAYPDVTQHILDKDDEFLVLACDGIWDCQTSQAVVEFVRRGIAAKQELHKICENLMDNCLASSSETGGLGCDNMTVIIVGFLQGKTKEEWYDMIAKRVESENGSCMVSEYAEFDESEYSYNHWNNNHQVENYYEESKEPETQNETTVSFENIRFGCPSRILVLDDNSDLLSDHDEVLSEINDCMDELEDEPGIEYDKHEEINNL
ncbi:uncharacterized protein T551_00167 [Pneumocystis jirovecii RU7]|uniref:protein-serine/threonine phosphatase n=2 Tax=Pneumocystis jirovecii TaxID=42068 RepID=A0A0W4ZWD6_PNEJ7|nr:uncharacterized protein T551_00167 [Pneumocystis jirovecii RU7]KTW32682.1 hypothetical protein T551_00167 [Pneumocystis jirovecii RU7]